MLRVTPDPWHLRKLQARARLSQMLEDNEALCAHAPGWGQGGSQGLAAGSATQSLASKCRK